MDPFLNSYLKITDYPFIPLDILPKILLSLLQKWHHLSPFSLQSFWLGVMRKSWVLLIFLHLHFCPKQLTVIHTFIHRCQWLPRKEPTSTSRAVWGSVSCPRTLRHAARGSRDLNQRPVLFKCHGTSPNYFTGALKKWQTLSETASLTA